ncbi:hypothetical protein LIPSTDRAFT_31439, partial [Lipomyces starkeyi NRRL Y-11557]
EARISLAIQAIDRGQIQSNRLAAKTYKVDRTTLKRRREGITSRRDSTPNNLKLTRNDLDSRGFSPRLASVEDMANQLLVTRTGGKVGK